MHGDIVATSAAFGSGIDSYHEADEFGNDAEAANPARYSWLGAHQRSRDSIGNLILMGARVYNPMTGSFLSPDPILGGNLTPYGYPEDPVGTSDLSGMSGSGCDDAGCDALWDTCRDYGNYLRCKFLFYLLKYDHDYSLKATKNANYQNAGRHFAFMVMSAILIGVDGAYALGEVHEDESSDATDSTRDMLNNHYSLGWYQRHTSYANNLVGHYRSKGDIEKLFDHGVDLFKRGYMYGVCAGEHKKISLGPCR
jgi:RHS repeat-associated protein